MESEVIKRLDAMHAAREEGLVRCRALIQLCSKSIRAMHREQFDEAESLLMQARTACQQAQATLIPFPEVQHAGFLRDAEKELVEAESTLGIIRGQGVPPLSDLSVSLVAYLHGIGEAASEVRRFALDVLRRGDLARAESILRQMEDVYDDLIELDYPDGMTAGLRRTTDALRAVVERTRSDLTTTASQQALVQELKQTRQSFER